MLNPLEAPTEYLATTCPLDADGHCSECDAASDVRACCAHMGKVSCLSHMRNDKAVCVVFKKHKTKYGGGGRACRPSCKGSANV